MKESVEASGLHLDETPVETAFGIGTEERYNDPMRLEYERIRADTDCQSGYEEFLRFALFLVSLTVGSEGLCPALFVFESIPRLAGTLPVSFQL